MACSVSQTSQLSLCSAGHYQAKWIKLTEEIQENEDIFNELLWAELLPEGTSVPMLTVYPPRPSLLMITWECSDVIKKEKTGQMKLNYRIFRRYDLSAFSAQLLQPDWSEPSRVAGLLSPPQQHICVTPQLAVARRDSLSCEINAEDFWGGGGSNDLSCSLVISDRRAAVWTSSPLSWRLMGDGGGNLIEAQLKDLRTLTVMRQEHLTARTLV